MRKFFFPLFGKLENGGKKKPDKQAKALEKVKFLELIFDNYFESPKPKFVDWFNDALANEVTEYFFKSLLLLLLLLMVSSIGS